MMGTPKSKSELKECNIIEKIELLNLGKEIGKELDISKLTVIFEKTKEILLPLVEWLDKPIFADKKWSIPKKFQDKRGLLLFEASFITIWLQRSGRWFISNDLYNIYSGSGEKSPREFEVSSAELTAALKKRIKRFLEISLRIYNQNFLENFPFIENLAVYQALILSVLPKFFENVNRVIKEREDRLQIIKSRLNSMDEFTRSLDPLASRGKSIQMKGYSIFGNDPGRSSRYTADYFCKEAINLFWQIANERHDKERFKEYDGERSFESIKSFLEYLASQLNEIDESKRGNRTNVKSLFGFSSGRLPFSKGELKVIKKAVDSALG